MRDDRGDESDARFGVPRDALPLAGAGVLLGLGLGGFFDGIVFHQILQWHHMLSAHHDPSVAGDLRLNVLADGLFHAATYLFTVAGVVQLWRARRSVAALWSGRTLLGGALLGWGIFNLVEGLVNHHLLAIHHVRPDGPGGALAWDLGFLLWGLLFAVGGYALLRSGDAAAPRRRGSVESDDTG